MENILIIPVLIGFFFSLFFIPFWISRAKKAGIVGKDMNKVSKIEVAEAGGIIVTMAFIFGVLVYIAIKTFIFKTDITTVQIFALLSTILLALLIGFIDDILGWKIGLRRRTRIFLLIFAAIPLMVINAGESTIIGIELGLWYPLLFIPIGIIGATTTFNFLAGYNSLETTQGILILSALGIVTYLTGTTWLSLVILIMIACLLAFYLFNKFPASVLPGDTLTYPIGALIATTAILGNIEKIAVFFFIPYIIETILKLRGKLVKESFAHVNSDGTLDVPYNKFYGLEHIAIAVIKKIKKDKKVHEAEVVYLINAFQILIIVLGFVLFRNSIF